MEAQVVARARDDSRVEAVEGGEVAGLEIGS